MLSSFRPRFMIIYIRCLERMPKGNYKESGLMIGTVSTLDVNRESDNDKPCLCPLSTTVPYTRPTTVTIWGTGDRRQGRQWNKASSDTGIGEHVILKINPPQMFILGGNWERQFSTLYVRASGVELTSRDLTKKAQLCTVDGYGRSLRSLDLLSGSLT